MNHNTFMQTFQRCVAAAIACSALTCVPAIAKDAPTATSVQSNAITGVVQEVIDVESYTYLRLKTKDGETWAAVVRAMVKNGTTVTIERPMVMKNFESKSLKRTFPSIVFGTMAGGALAGGSARTGSPAIADTAPIKVAKASGANARTVAEIMTMGAALKDQQVVLRGKVAKYNAAIMGKNWIHLRDGSGSAADGTDDILVTSASTTKMGDVITVTGVVRVDKDFGAGYSYKVLIEDAKIQP